MTIHSSILPWRIPWTELAWWATVHRVARGWKWLKQLARMHAPFYYKRNRGMTGRRDPLAKSKRALSSGASVELCFANPEAHQISSFKSFYRALIPSPAPPTTSEKDWWLGLTVSLSLSSDQPHCEAVWHKLRCDPSHMDVMSANCVSSMECFVVVFLIV